MFLATKLHGSILDLIVVSLLIFVSLIGLRQGFVNRLVGVVAGIVALIVAFSLCKPFASLLNITFNMQESLASSLTRSFAKNESLNVTVTDVEQVKNLLDNQNLLPSFVKNAVLKVTDYAGDNTLSQILGQVCSKYAVIGIAFVILWVVVRLACILLKFVFARIEDNHSSIFLANKILGVCLGFLQCLLVICAIIFVVSMLPTGAFGWLQNTIDQSKICAFISKHNIFAPLFTLMLGF